MSAERERLSADWTALLYRYRAAAAARSAAFEELAAAYGSSDRHYHTLTHVAQVLETVTLLQNEAQDADAVRLAGWLHDVVYDPRAADNEERSADYAGLVLPRLAVPPPTVAHVQELIRLTKTHRASAGDRDGMVLLDADLFVLGSDEAEYAAYARAIRQEYAWVPDEEYRAGRTRVLQAFLRRPRIFSTERLAQQREAAARRNLQREIDGLEQGREPGSL